MTLTQLRKALRTAAYPREVRYLRRGLAAALEHRDVLRNLPPLASIIDVGANRGQFVLEALKWHPSSHIIALEPLGSERAVLDEIAARNPNVKVLPYAAGSIDGADFLNVTASPDSSSLLRSSDMQVAAFPGTHFAHREEIHLRRLDGLSELRDIEQPLLCKIDVQGYEREVVRGGGAVLARAQHIIVELSNAPLYIDQPNSAEVISDLNELGFRIVDIYNISRVGRRCVQADFLLQRVDP